MLFYVFIYSIWLKRSTPQNIVIGGIAGSTPPLVGWASAESDLQLSTESASLFIDSVTLLEPSDFVFSLSYVTDTCGRSVGEAAVNLSGGVPPYMVNWSNGGIDLVQNNFSQGIYDVVVKDNNDCQK